MRKIPLKILYTIPNFITAGSGRVIANIAMRLDRKKFTPTVCVAHKGGFIESELEAHGIQVLEVPFTVNAKPYSGLWRRVKKTAREFNPYQFDLWHSFHYADDYTEPMIAWLAGSEGWVFTKKNMMWGANAWQVRSLLASKIIADNKDMPEMFFKRFYLRKKVRLIPHGIDTEKFKPLTIPKEGIRKNLGLPKDAVLVGLVAHIVPVKGHEFIITAAAQCPNIHFVFAGQTNVEDYFVLLQSLIKKLDLSERIHFVGVISNVPDFLAQMDIIVLPTRKRGEGCPVSLLEAMACGKASIATDVPGSHDIIENGISGLLVPPDDPASLAQAIRLLLENPDLRQKLGAAARKRIVEHYTIEKEVLAHEKLYMEILSKRGN